MMIISMASLAMAGCGTSLTITQAAQVSSAASAVNVEDMVQSEAVYSSADEQTQVLSGEDGAASCLSWLESWDGTTSFTGIGGYSPSSEISSEVSSMIDAIADDGYDVGFLVLDIRTGAGAAYNTNEVFYSASTSKAAYVVSLASYSPDDAFENESKILDVTENSSNESYSYLVHNFGLDYYKEWCEKAGIDSSVTSGGYADYSAEDLALLWLLNYQYFISGDSGETVASWFENPATSAIHSVLGTEYTTQSKAGWCYSSDGTDDYTSTNDAGIVYAGDYPYICVIMTNYPSDVNYLKDYIPVLNDIHEDLISQVTQTQT